MAIFTAVAVGGIGDGVLVGVLVTVGIRVGVDVGVGVVGIMLLLHDAASRTMSRTAYLSLVFMGISFLHTQYTDTQMPKQFIYVPKNANRESGNCLREERLI